MHDDHVPVACALQDRPPAEVVQVRPNRDGIPASTFPGRFDPRASTDHHDRDRLKAEIAPIETELRTLLEDASPKSKRTRWHRRFANNLLKIWPAPWTFTTIEGVEPTNNPAERALRAPVIHRKLRSLDIDIDIEDPILARDKTPAVRGSTFSSWWAQSDLDVPAHLTRTLGLMLEPCARPLLGARCHMSVLITADSSETLAEPKSQQAQLNYLDSEVVTLLAS